MTFSGTKPLERKELLFPPLRKGSNLIGQDDFFSPQAFHSKDDPTDPNTKNKTGSKIPLPKKENKRHKSMKQQQQQQQQQHQQQHTQQTLENKSTHTTHSLENLEEKTDSKDVHTPPNRQSAGTIFLHVCLMMFFQIYELFC